MLETAIIGAAGLTGRELLSVLSRHPGVQPTWITSEKHKGLPVSEVFPEFEGMYDLAFHSHNEKIPDGLVVFLATPNETSAKMVPELVNAGHKVIDLSGSFRLKDERMFESFYGFKHPSFVWTETAVYGLPELYRDSIRKANLIANPGCYPTGSIIPLHFLRDYHDQIQTVIIDAKSGVSGAGGRTEDSGFAFGSVYENFRAYKILKHQHTPEIDTYSGQIPPVVFTPHLLPLFRGILSTITVIWKNEAPHIEERFRSYASAEPFVRFLSSPEEVNLKRVQHTNYIDIGLRSAENRTVIVSAIDNLIKGAAGQAVQNLNLMTGLEETTGFF